MVSGHRACVLLLAFRLEISGARAKVKSQINVRGRKGLEWKFGIETLRSRI